MGPPESGHKESEQCMREGGDGVVLEFTNGGGGDKIVCSETPLRATEKEKKNKKREMKRNRKN